MKRRLALVGVLAALLATLILPSAASAAKGPYRWQVLGNNCGSAMTMDIEFTVLGASRANKVIITGQVQQLVNGKWHKGRINGRTVGMFAANGQPHKAGRCSGRRS